MTVVTQTLPPRTVATLDRIAVAGLLLIPLLLLHAHGIAEGAIGVVDLCFLARSGLTRDWDWLRTRWLLVGWVWWGWVVVCSLPLPALALGEGGGRSLVQALVTVRFLVFVAAMEHVVLRQVWVRRWLFGLLAAAAIYIEVQSLVQWLFGRNLYGVKEAYGDVLTGPFAKPRAAAPLSRLQLPTLVPVLARWSDRPGIAPKVAAGALLIVAIAIQILIGQTVPVLIVCSGLIVAGLLLPRLRPAVLATAVAVVLLIPGLVVISPPTYGRLVSRAVGILEHFPTTQYGELYARALEIGTRNPVTGLGFDGFATGCPKPTYFRPSFDHVLQDGGGAAICWDHPHNFYLQALSDGGLPGLALFCCLAAVWLVPLARGLWRHPDPLRVGLFAVTLVQLWPIQSTSAFTSMPMGGWFFLLLGWGLAEARHAAPPPEASDAAAPPR
jgi:O-antigen ligase